MIKKLFKSMCIVFEYAPCAATIKVLEILVMATMPPLSLFFTQRLIDSILPYINGTTSISSIVLWSILLLVTVLISANYNLINNIQKIIIQRKLNEGFTEEVVNKFKKIDFCCFEDSEIQDTLNRMGDSPQDMILEIFLNIVEVISQIITIIGFMIVFGQVSVWFSVVFLIILLIMVRLDFKAMNMVNDMLNSQTEEERKMEYLSNLLSDKSSLFELKIFGTIEYITNIWREKTKNVLKERLKMTIRSQKYFAISSGFVLLWIANVVFFMIFSITHNKISVGLFVSVIGSATSVMNNTNVLSNTCSNLSRKYLQMEHYEIFKGLPEIVENKDKGEGNCFPIVFDNVWFKYPKAKDYVLKGVSFEIKPNERIAIVGENGAGKSTIIKLLCRLYKPDSGRITIGGKDINTLGEKEFKRVISVVFQDYVNYSLTLRENVAFGDIDRLWDDDAIYTALTQSLAENICDNIDVNLGKIEENGIDLSGGQWQKIAIARAYIANSSFIILDEPTAALDPIAESRMYETFIKILKNKGCIIISHRLASAKMTDKIIVISKGKVVECGSHEELINENSTYAKMWRVQSEWYKVGDMCE